MSSNEKNDLVLKFGREIGSSRGRKVVFDRRNKTSTRWVAGVEVLPLSWECQYSEPLGELEGSPDTLLDKDAEARVPTMECVLKDRKQDFAISTVNEEVGTVDKKLKIYKNVNCRK